MHNAKWVLLVLILVSPLVAERLPSWWIWENGPLEWLQVGLLALCLAVSVWWARLARRQGDGLSANFWGGLVVVWILAMGRELSWGRVFMIEGYYANGPRPIPSAEYPYRALVRAIQFVLGGVYLAAFLGLRLDRFPRAMFRLRRLPWGEILVTCAAAALAQFGGHTLRSARQEECGEVCFLLGCLLVVLAMRPRQPGLTSLLTRQSPGP